MSTNVSKQRREELLKKINEIRSFLSYNGGNELLTYLSDLEGELKRQKYGLVFEEHRETIDEVLETNTPVFTEQSELNIDNGGLQNFLIEGDNLLALKLLQKTHKGKIDLIYIDPPYNRGKEKLFYPDYIVGVSEEIWIIEAKGGESKDGKDENIDKYAEMKSHTLNKYLKKYALKGGFVRLNKVDMELYINTTKYCESLNDKSWRKIEELL